MAAVAAVVVAIHRMAAAMAMAVHTVAQVNCAWSNGERKECKRNVKSSNQD